MSCLYVFAAVCTYSTVEYHFFTIVILNGTCSCSDIGRFVSIVMYTGDIASTTSQGNTKSTIQALLLRNREQRPTSDKSTDSALKDKSVLNIYSNGSDFANTRAKKSESDTKNQSSPEYSPNGNSQQESL